MHSKISVVKILFLIVISLLLFVSCYMSTFDKIFEKVATPQIVVAGYTSSSYYSSGSYSTKYAVISISCATDGATIMYSIDESAYKDYESNTSSYYSNGVYITGIKVPLNSSLEVYAQKDGLEDSETVEEWIY